MTSLAPTIPAIADVVDRTATAVAVPKAAPADSFVLHAPLELMGRVGLLPYVAPARADDALGMIEWLGDQYSSAGEPVPTPPAVEVDVADPAATARLLLAAVGDGDLDRVDAIAAALLPHLSAHEAAGLLAGGVITSLAAAGHAPIGFALLGRVRPVLPTALLRGPLRGIASQPAWQIDWQRGLDGKGDAALLFDALRHVPRLGRPGSDFIYPLMSQAQNSGVARDLLAPVLADRFDVTAARRTLTRVAAWSMIHDDRAHAPYGWTHALTMTQGVMALAGAGVTPRDALAVSATFMVGFRAALSSADLPDVIDVGPMPEASVEEIATAAALHEDAHLVKYVLACLHAADDDPAFRALYLSAAASLVEWWKAWAD